MTVLNGMDEENKELEQEYGAIQTNSGLVATKQRRADAPLVTLQRVRGRDRQRRKYCRGVLRMMAKGTTSIESCLGQGVQDER